MWWLHKAMKKRKQSKPNARRCKLSAKCGRRRWGWWRCSVLLLFLIYRDKEMTKRWLLPRRTAQTAKRTIRTDHYSRKPSHDSASHAACMRLPMKKAANQRTERAQKWDGEEHYVSRGACIQQPLSNFHHIRPLLALFLLSLFLGRTTGASVRDQVRGRKGKGLTLKFHPG